ncbi:MAG TPA: S1 RNA-binding domain-containing protein [Abditibacteriaceae bacterium]
MENAQTNNVNTDNVNDTVNTDSTNSDSADNNLSVAAAQNATAGSEAGASLNTESNEAAASATPLAGATSAPTPPAAPATAPSAETRPSRQPSMAEVMESGTYMTGIETLRPNTLLKGIVVRIDENTNEVMVDIGSKSEGIISKEHAGRDEINIGDEVEVVVIRPENDEGHPILSKARADYKRLWRELSQAKTDRTNVEGTVTEQVKGGLIIDLGVRAFIPARYVDTRNKGDLGRFVGRSLSVKILEIDEKRSKVIASHLDASAEERKAKEEAAWANIEKDKVIEGTVQRITDFGAFIDLGGIDGLLHVREMSWGRVDHPKNVLKVGQKVEVLVLDIDESTKPKRIALGLKQLLPDPWKKAARTYRPGQMITGKVTRLAPSCAFVELEEGIEAIIPISEMSEQRIKTPDEVLTVGQQIEGRVKQVEPRQRRISLSLKAAVQEKERRETRSTMREINERGGDDEVRLGDVFGQALRAAKERGKERERATTTNRAVARERALQAAEEEESDWEETGDEVVADDAVAEEATEATSDDTAPGETAPDGNGAETSLANQDDASGEGEKGINTDSLPGALQEDTTTDNLPDGDDAGTPVADDIAGDESNSGQSSPVA